MIPYLLLLLVVVYLAYVGRRNGSKGVRLLSQAIVVLILVLFAGLRHRWVGTDTGNYIAIFAGVNTVNDLWRSTEIGFNSLMLLAKTMSAGYTVLLTLIALVTVSCYVATLARLNQRYETSLFVFMTLGAYTFFFNGARQGIAAAICFFAIPWLLKRKPWPYFLLIAVAYTFHNTALIAVPIYFLAIPRVGWRQVAIVAGSTVLTILFLTVFVQVAADLLNDRYASYAEASEGGGMVMATFLVGQGALLFLLRKQIKNSNGTYARLLNIYLIGLIPVIASVVSNVNPSGLLRLHPYFAYTAILLWPMFLQSIRNIKQRRLLSVVFALVMLAFYYLTTKAFSNLAPYTINMDIFS